MRRLLRPWRRCCIAAALLGAAGPSLTHAYTLDPDSTDSIKSISKQIAADMIENYYPARLPGNEPGLLPSPYYWWEAGALMGTLINYWYHTGDTTYNNMTTDGLLAQVGEYNDYMPKAQILNEGNDDQGFWGMAVMAAAEYRFPDPPKDKPQWLALAQAVFNTQASRWDPATCGGGLRWQIFNWNNGYDYKNTISQGCFFNIAARLALYTGNTSYAQWAERTWDWTRAVGFIDSDYSVYDGGHVPKNCTNIVPYQWSYNIGSFMHGAAALYNLSTGAEREKWRIRLDGMLNHSAIFFSNTSIMFEVPCETVYMCNTDQQSFKAYLSRWMAAMTKWAPWTYERIMPLLRASAVAAVKQCTAGSNGRMCGLRWIDNGQNDGLLGLGQQMAALEVTVGLMEKYVGDPVTDKTGGTSQGDPGAGGNDMGFRDPSDLLVSFPPLGPGDRAGAYILTILALAGLIGGIVFVTVDETDGKTWRERLSDLRVFIVGGGTALVAGGGMLRKSQQFNEDRKGKAVVHTKPVPSPSDSDSGREKRASSRVLFDLPAGIVDTATAPEQQQHQTQGEKPLPQVPLPSPLSPRQQPKTLHRKSKSMPAWGRDPELGIAPAPPVPGEGFRRSASQQMKGGLLKKRSSANGRPASLSEL